MEKLTHASTFEYQASLFGAGFIGFGLGFLLSNVFGRFSIVILLLGVLMHGWGMLRIHKRNNN